MADPIIDEGRSPFEISVAIAVKAGDTMAHNGSAWVKADADDPTLYARGFAGHAVDGVLQTLLTVYKEVMLHDEDAPYTVGAKQYLSGTAGAHTATRPTGDGAIVQVLGQAVTTKIAHLVAKDLQEVEVPIIVDYATSANALLDSGNFGGPTLDAQNEVCVMHAILPDNAVSLALAELYLAAEALIGSPTYNLAVSSSLDGAQHDAITPDTSFTAGVLAGAAADEMQVTDITTAMDATNIVRPGAILGLKATKSDAGTDISLIFGGRIICNVV